MSKVMNELFLDTPNETAADMLAGDPEYGEWNDKLEEQLQKEFGNQESDEPAF